MPLCIIRPCIVVTVKWHQLIDRLVDEAGGSLPVAKAMKAETFQGTLYRITKGRIGDPSRNSVERIAKHFNIPAEALYDDAVAAQVYAERFPDDAGEVARAVVVEPAPAVEAREPDADYNAAAQPSVGQLALQLAAMLQRLDDPDREMVAGLLVGMLKSGPSENGARAIDALAQGSPTDETDQDEPSGATFASTRSAIVGRASERRIEGNKSISGGKAVARSDKAAKS